MKTIVVNKSKVAERRTEKEAEKSENICLIFAVLFMGAGFFAPLLGMVLAIVHSILVADVVFNRISTILFVAAIPLLFVGSHFMDVERERRKKRKQDEFQRKIRN